MWEHKVVNKNSKLKVLLLSIVVTLGLALSGSVEAQSKRGVKRKVDRGEKTIGDILNVKK